MGGFTADFTVSLCCCFFVIFPIIILCKNRAQKFTEHKFDTEQTSRMMTVLETV